MKDEPADTGAGPDRRAPRTLLWTAIAIMLVFSFLRLTTELPRLVHDPGPRGAIDLKLRYKEVHRWFDGRPVYAELVDAVYPPATYALLWPFLGWSDLARARWIWGVTGLLALAALVWIGVRATRAARPGERLLVGLIPFATYAPNVALGNGQLIVHLLPPLTAGFLLLHRRERSAGLDLTAAALLTFALMKPSITLPFLVPLLFVRRAWRPLLFAGLGYAALTVLAASFREANLVRLVSDWLAVSRRIAEEGAWVGSYANVQTWLVYLGRPSWYPIVAGALVVFQLGWTARHRQVDPWRMLAVAALVARFWMYHRVYDDLLVLLPMISLFREARPAWPGARPSATAGVLFALTLAAALAPARLHESSPPWNHLFEFGQTAVWLSVLVFLLRPPRGDRNLPGVND